VRLERFEVVPFALPFREPYVTARGRLDRRELLLLRLRANGCEGLGEAAPLALRGGPGLSQLKDELEQGCRPLLERELTEASGPPALIAGCARSGVSLQTLAAVDLALHDLYARLARQPLWQLLGADQVRAVNCNATLVAGPPRAVAERATRLAQAGFSTFKLKVGVDRDVEQVQAVRDAVGPKARIRIDANGVWTANGAVVRLGELERLVIELAEQPAATLADLAAVRRQTSIPIAADESVANADDARRALEAGACDAATVKLAKVGGIAAARSVVSLLPVYLSSALDGPVGIAAAAHLAQLLPRSGFAAELHHGLATAELFDGTVASVECRLDGPFLRPPDGPGLGVEIDERALAKSRL